MKARLTPAVRLITTLLLISSVVLMSPLSIGADDTDGTAQQPTSDLGAARAGAEPQSGNEALGLFRTVTLNGGYVAKGAGLRNTGYTFIPLDGVPAGATVTEAYLYWTVLSSTATRSLPRGYFNGNLVTGTKIGTSGTMNWGPSQTFSYRASLPAAWISGNKAYTLTGFASGSWKAEDTLASATPPLAEGATLVVIYSKPSYPLTTIKIYDGAVSLNVPGESYALTINGFTATNPVGPSSATFFGGDGQSYADGPTTFNGNTLASVTWGGSDPKFGPASNGNLWDTHTASVGSYISPGATSATATVNCSEDAFVWAGLVFSISPGNIDTDGDKLLDGWEANGYSGVNLPGMGANPFHKDIFVEVDWMAAGDPDPGISHKPPAAVIDESVAMFAKAPISNPDGVNGVTLHVDDGRLGGGNAIAHQEHLGTMAGSDYSWAAFDVVKAANFSSNRQKLFHYSVFAHDLAPELGSVSGISRGIPASDFIVSLGSWPSGGDTNARIGTFIHEFGHNLSLKHGGNDHGNYKPNYISVMNYAFQVTGLRKNGVDGVWNYSWTALPSLNETNLNENIGLNGGAPIANYGTKYKSGGSLWTVNNANGPIDWNRNGSATQTGLSADINGDGYKTVLGTQNNWANIVYDGGLVGPGAKPQAEVPATPAEELTFEEAYPTGEAAPAE